eukprot:7139456-Pyramimonas_sp.AAC.1
MEAFLDRETLRELRRLEGLAEPILDLQSSADLSKLRNNVKGVTTWKQSLSSGLLPDNDIEWPDETFRDALLVRPPVQCILVHNATLSVGSIPFEVTAREVDLKI